MLDNPVKNGYGTAFLKKENGMSLTVLLITGGAALVTGVVTAARAGVKRQERREAERKRLTPTVWETANAVGIPLMFQERIAPKRDVVGRLYMNNDGADYLTVTGRPLPPGFIPQGDSRIICCNYTHREFYKREQCYSYDPYHRIQKLEEVVSRDGICEYLLIGWCCNVCGHFAPNPKAADPGSIYAAGIVEHRNLFDWLESFDRAAVLTARRENLERQLDEVRLQLFNAAQANPASLGHHPLREHPTLSLTGTKGKTA